MNARIATGGFTSMCNINTLLYSPHRYVSIVVPRNLQLNCSPPSHVLTNKTDRYNSKLPFFSRVMFQKLPFSSRVVFQTFISQYIYWKKIWALKYLRNRFKSIPGKSVLEIEHRYEMWTIPVNLSLFCKIGKTSKNGQDYVWGLASMFLSPQLYNKCKLVF